MKRSTKNDRTITLTQPALQVYDSWPHMEKSKRVSDAIIAKAQNSSGEFETRVSKLEKRVEKLEGDK